MTSFTAHLPGMDKQGELQRNSWLDIETSDGLISFAQTSPFKAVIVSKIGVDHAWPWAPLDHVGPQNGARWEIDIDGEVYEVGIIEATCAVDGNYATTYVMKQGDRRGDLVQLTLYKDVARFVIHNKRVKIPELAWNVQITLTRMALAHIEALPLYLSSGRASTGAVA